LVANQCSYNMPVRLFRPIGRKPALRLTMA
jgi:hypothetical protein